jgi:hypothetical protein
MKRQISRSGRIQIWDRVKSLAANEKEVFNSACWPFYCSLRVRLRYRLND